MSARTPPKLRAIDGTPADERWARDPERPLIEAAQAGDRGAWDRLYQAHYDAVFARVRALVGETHTAEELSQDTFFQGLVKLDRYDGRAPLRTWLRAIALNIVRNHWRSQRTRKHAHAALAVVAEVGGRGESSSPERSVLRRQRSEALYRALERIPEHLREVFVLRMIEGVDRRATAEALDISPNNVSVRCIRARERLEDELRAMGCLPPKEEEG